MKEVVVLLVAIFGATSSKYLLVQLEDASKEEMNETWRDGKIQRWPLNGGLVDDDTKYPSKYDLNRFE